MILSYNEKVSEQSYLSIVASADLLSVYMCSD